MRFSASETYQLYAMFYKIQTVFDSVKGKRSNYLYYGYMIRKCCEIKKWYHYAIKLPMLTSTDCIRMHDEIWEKICEILNWKYIESSLINDYTGVKRGNDDRLNCIFRININ